MTNTDTADIDGTVTQVAAARARGSRARAHYGEYRRRGGPRLPHIRERLAAKGVDVPLVGDFIQRPSSADAAPGVAEALAKLRIQSRNVGRGRRRDEQFATMIEFACKYAKPVRIASTGAASTRADCAHDDENARSAAPQDAAVVTRKRWSPPRSTARGRRRAWGWRDPKSYCRARSAACRT